jgi:hypothetical protein
MGFGGGTVDAVVEAAETIITFEFTFAGMTAF